MTESSMPAPNHIPDRIEAEPQGSPTAEAYASAFRHRGWLGRVAALGLCLVMALPSPESSAASTEETVESDLGALRLIHPEGAPKGLLFYLAGARGWDAATDATARALADQAYVVAGIEANTLSSPSPDGACRNLAATLARLAGQLGPQAQIPAGSLPLVLGDTEGASLAYAALLQGPPHSFHAVLTLDFCPADPVDQVLCPGVDGTTQILQDGRPRPVPRVESTWFALETDRGSACPGDSVDSFVAQVDNARLVSAGGGPAATGGGGDWQRQLISLVQWLDPRIQDQLGVTVSTEDVAGLPLIETPAGQVEQTTFAVMLSGDGGWAALDRGLSAELAARGIRTVGWDSLAYFWKARSPEEASPDLARVIDHYLGAWHKRRVVLIGYSLGADVLPFLVSRLPARVRGSVALVVLLGPSPAASFEFHLSDWFSSTASSDAVATLPEIQRLAPTPRLCIYGDAEQLSVCPALAGSGVELRKVPGDHHFSNDYKGLADLILNALGTADQADP